MTSSHNWGTPNSCHYSDPVAGVSGETSDLSARTTRPQSLIITIYGAYSRSLGGWFSAGSLLTMLDVLGVDESSVRGTLSRLKRRGILIADRRDGSAGYALGDAAWRTFELGDPRVLERRKPPPNEGWVLAAFSIPETSRDLRYRLRSRLSRVGFSQVSGGLWIAPRQLEQDLRHVVSQLDVGRFVDIFTADHCGPRPTREAVRGWWDLDEIGALYLQFVSEFRTTATYWRRANMVNAERAFADYTRALTAWRPIPYRDPGLPAEFLPKSWAGYRATTLFFSLHDRLSIPARDFAARA